jgi:quercetin dioxygenase-like cupin family protein
MPQRAHIGCRDGGRRGDAGRGVSLSSDELERFVAGLAARPEEWLRFVTHAGDARAYEQIWEDEEVNAWLICWSDGQDTGFHDHDDSAAAIVVIEGHVREERLRLAAACDARVFGPGTMFTVAPSAIHRVLHAGNAPAVTIHAYSPPLRRSGTYRVGPGGELERVAQSCELELRADPALY